MRNKSLALLKTLSIVWLLLVLVSACAPSPAVTTPDTANQKHSPSTATGHYQPLLVPGMQQFNLAPYSRIPLVESQLEVSSFSEPWDKAYLVKPGTEGFWHIRRPRQEERAWVLVDLETEQAVPLLRAKPRTGFADQMWYGYTAELEASNDKQNWTPLAVLSVHRTNLTDDWLYFLVGNLQPYRYYRLSVWDRYFFSMARVELYQFR